MEFSEDQRRAWARLERTLHASGIDLPGASLVSGGGRQPTLAVLGRAGSGKTLLLAELVKALVAAGVETVSADYESRKTRTRRTLAVLAPTNKAASVLRARGVPATTIHRILYTPLYHPDYEAIAEWLTGKGDRPKVENLTEEALDRAFAFFQQHPSIPGALASAGLRGSDFIKGWKRRDEPLDIGLIDEASMLDAAAAKDGRVVVSPRVDAGVMARSPVLVWRNVTRVRLIQAFRTAYGAPELALVPGEPLVCDGIELPLKHRKKRMDLEARGLTKGAQVIYLGPSSRAGFARLHVVGAEDPRVGVASIIQLEAPGEAEPRIVTAASMGAVFLHGAAVTIHKAQGSQWPTVQVFAPDLWAAAQSGRSEAGIALWKRLAYVAVTRAEERLVWVTRYALARPTAPLGIEDLPSAAPKLELTAEA